VTARNSSFQFRKQRIDVRDAGKKLGVQYVLEGSVRQSEPKDIVRVTFQLADTRTGNHIWAERYDRKLEDVFALQEEIVDRVAVAIDVKLIQGDLTIRRRLSTKSYEAYKLYRRASELNLEFTPGANDQSIVLAMQALEIDPQFVLAWALIGWAHHSRAAFGWSRDPRRDLEIAWDNAQTALATNPDQVEALILAGFLQVYRHQYDDAHRLTARAVEIDSSDAVAAGVQGLVYTWSGAPELGLAKMKRAMEMSPVTPSWMDLELGNAQLMLRQHGDAIANLERAVQKTPLWLPARWLLAVAYAEAGRIEDAKRQFDKAIEIDPSITLGHPNIQFDLNADKEFVKRIYAALRQAGLK
jgi:adenylate cyclase